MSLTFIFGAIIVILASTAALSIIYWTIKNGISPMPSTEAVKKVILDSIPEDTKGPIYELGSGWGTLAFFLADKFPHCRIEAYETSHIPYLFCKMRQWIKCRENLHFHRHDFFIVPLGNAKIVVCYLYPEAMQKLKAKFNEELPSGCCIISNTFAIPGCQPQHVVEMPDLYRTKVYVYLQNKEVK